MLQNRVDPFGNLIQTTARGAWMGNRGLIHNQHQQIVRPFRLKAWLCCRLEFRGRKRQVMSPNLYTELFFLDEATAFAAGHRPCFECRRSDYEKFKKLWIQGNSSYHFDDSVSIQKIDAILHQERISLTNTKVTFMAKAASLPDGCFILINKKPYLVQAGKFFLWTPFSYKDGISAPAEKITVLTPASVVNTFRAGYVPQIGTSPPDLTARNSIS